MVWHTIIQPLLGRAHHDVFRDLGLGFIFPGVLRLVRSYTVKYQYPKRNIEQVLINQVGSKYFATFHFLEGYWQFPLDKAAHGLQSIITQDKKIQSPTCNLLSTKSFLEKLYGISTTGLTTS